MVSVPNTQTGGIHHKEIETQWYKEQTPLNKKVLLITNNSHY